MAQAAIRLIKSDQSAKAPSGPAGSDHSDYFRKVGEKCHDFESEICDIRSMARLNAEALESAIRGGRDTTHDQYILYPQQIETLSFSAYHLENLIIELTRRYLAALKSK